MTAQPAATATTWLRKRGQTFCAVLRVDDASVATHCNAVWDAAALLELELHDAPHVAEQCAACVAAIALEQQRCAAAEGLDAYTPPNAELGHDFSYPVVAVGQERP